MFEQRREKMVVPGTQPERNSDGVEKSTFETIGGLIETGELTIQMLENALDKEGTTEGITLAQYRVLNRKLHEKKDSAREKLENELIRAHIDGLTSLTRRDYFKPRTDRLISELYYPKEHRSSPLQALVVIKLDINNFKPFNEHPYNHDVGDQALIAVADRLRSITKEGMDVVCRYGGDEFALVLQVFDTGVDFTDLFAKKKELINENLSIQAPNGDVLPLTLSMGYSVAEKGKNKTTEQLLQEAESMERQDKNGGDDELKK